MPFARIDLHKRKPPEYLTSESVKEALALLGSPSDDNFQIITQHDPGALVFNRGSRVLDWDTRSGVVVITKVSAALDHDEQSCYAFYRRLVDVLGQRPGIRSEDVFLMLHSCPLWYHSFAGWVPLRLRQGR